MTREEFTWFVVAGVDAAVRLGVHPAESADRLIREALAMAWPPDGSEGELIRACQRGVNLAQSMTPEEREGLGHVREFTVEEMSRFFECDIETDRNGPGLG